MSARVVTFPSTSMPADLSEALDAVDLLNEALIQSIGESAPTGLQAAALAVVAGLRHKHDREPAPTPPRTA